MATDDPIRASDSDREAVVATLRDAYTAGRLTLEEFDERTSAAYAGKTWGDLRALTVDLPVQPVLGSDIPGRPLPERPAAVQPGPRPPGPPRPLLPPPGSLPPVRRRRPVGLLIPVVVWSLLALNSGQANGLVSLAIVVAIFAVIFTLVRRR